MTQTFESIRVSDVDISSSFEGDIGWYAVSMVGGGPVILQYVPEERQVYSATERDEEIAERRVQFLRSRNVPVLHSVGDEESWEAEMSRKAATARL